jgi:hypothetical protein
MSHFYKPQKDGTAKLVNSITTPTQARGKQALASVTTMLGVIPSDFLNKWSRKQVWDLAREGHTFDECERRRYGMRTDVDGKEVPSAQFGTSVHSALEHHLERMADGDLSPNNGPYAVYVNPFAEWFRENGYTLVEAETTCYCLRRKTAGTIDVLAKDADGRFVLMDFKTRSVREGVNPSSKVYLKDSAQLAVEADIIREREELDYTPKTISIIIATEDGRTGIRHWPLDKQEYALEVFEACSNLYLTINKLK